MTGNIYNPGRKKTVKGDRRSRQTPPSRARIIYFIRSENIQRIGRPNYHENALAARSTYVFGHSYFFPPEKEKKENEQPFVSYFFRGSATKRIYFFFPSKTKLPRVSVVFCQSTTRKPKKRQVY